MSTNKVYGDAPNTIALKELPTRWDYADPAYAHGIAEDFPIDQSKHSLFGASQGRGRRDGAGVRPLLRHADLLPARRLPDRAQPQRRRAARLPELPGQVQPGGRGRTRSSATRASRCATTSTRYDVARFIDAFCRSAARRARSTTSAAAGTTRARSSRRSTGSRHSAARRCSHDYVDKNREGDHICYISDLRRCGPTTRAGTSPNRSKTCSMTSRRRGGVGPPRERVTTAGRGQRRRPGPHSRRRTPPLSALGGIPGRSATGRARREVALLRSGKGAASRPARFGRIQLRPPGPAALALGPLLARRGARPYGCHSGRVAASLGDFHPEAVLTVTDFGLWQAAATYARRTRLPLYLVQHDDLASKLSGNGPKVQHRLTRWLLDRQVGRVYRQARREVLRQPRHGRPIPRQVRCVVRGRLPEPRRGQPRAPRPGPADRWRPANDRVRRRAYTEGGRDLLRRLAGILRGLGGRLDLYMRDDARVLERYGLDLPNVRPVGFFPPKEMAERMAVSAHALFLPASFLPNEAFDVATLFPSKLADYTAVGLPLLTGVRITVPPFVG